MGRETGEAMERMMGEERSGWNGFAQRQNPIILYSSLLSPKKNMATVPGPVCAPIVVPML